MAENEIAIQPMVREVIVKLTDYRVGVVVPYAESGRDAWGKVGTCG